MQVCQRIKLVSNVRALETAKDIIQKSVLNTYAVVDGAACPELSFMAYDYSAEVHCLWSGDMTEDVREVAPYLVPLKIGQKFTDWLLEYGIEKECFVIFESDLETDKFKSRFKKFLLIRSLEGEPQIFRIYDPRIFSIFHRFLDDEQSSELYSVIHKAFCFIKDKGKFEFVSFNIDLSQK